jgi:hypothetical protein
MADHDQLRPGLDPSSKRSELHPLETIEVEVKNGQLVVRVNRRFSLTRKVLEGGSNPGSLEAPNHGGREARHQVGILTERTDAEGRVIGAAGYIRYWGVVEVDPERSEFEADGLPNPLSEIRVSHSSQSHVAGEGSGR